MIAFFIDFVTVAALIIGITALIGVITNNIGEKLFGGKEKMKFVNKSLDVQSGWNQVGGKGIYKKRTY
ncbi:MULTISPECIES: hypothetical protein [Bacillus cereus group]|uniref:hypothetical protein n=1 Tax=Bacillus cereus group TaxID=86661 RepID=UPI0008FDF868|nr:MULTISPECIES: hypothetical protein [Bacillus cereus group]MDG1619799.1 hypothetical protein [Bacillus mobilis]MDX5836624.1 hypothetical protein [Bacillus cereus group sp. BfR-BA-01700]MED4387251.1 hypothetical protein [Bacillus mobilis]OJE43253.1 hypothetical protein BAQ44_05650 [Bacillus mobilis]HDR7239525.1 hypothetical protein [Bacillus mobilis]